VFIKMVVPLLRPSISRRRSADATTSTKATRPPGASSLCPTVDLSRSPVGFEAPEGVVRSARIWMMTAM
jgi:hypothetical protein